MQNSANAAASANSGMEKTKATLEEKTERMMTRDESKKDDKKTAAEFNNKEAKDQNAAARHGGAQGYTTTGEAKYDPMIGGGGPVAFDHPTAKTQDPSFPC